ncbi:MAG: type II toxin-antitoxin system RelE/ParE family toxin [Gemmatales bacterium]
MIEIIDEASNEIDEAFDWYLKRSIRAASEFQRRLKNALMQIDASPWLGTLFTEDAYWVRIKKYPYLLIYQNRTPIIRVIAVAHQSRRPGYWVKRV